MSEAEITVSENRGLRSVCGDTRYAEVGGADKKVHVFV